MKYTSTMVTNLICTLNLILKPQYLGFNQFLHYFCTYLHAFLGHCYIYFDTFPRYKL